VSQILVRFTQDVVPSSLNDSSVIFVGRRSGIHRVSFAYDPATKTCTLTPQGKILDGEAVDITLTTGVALANGDPVLAPFSWSFFARVYKGSAMLNKEREFPLGAIPLSLCAADLDGDGFADIAVTNNGSNTLSLFRSVPGTGVVQQPDYPVGPGPRYIAASDLDGDGKTDLIVTTYNSLAILKNNGNFSFAKSVVAGNGALTGLAVADFDGDGRPDVAVSRGDESCVQIFRNMGGMKFTPMTLPFTFPYAARLYAGDLNDDGRNDLLVLRNGGNSLTVMKNDGFMHFSPVSLVNAGGVSRAASLADFDNDGRLDIAVDNMYGGCLSIFYNKGNFVFDNVPQSAVHPAPVTIEAADFDADGDLDIAESTDSSPTSTTIAVRSDSSFYPRQQFMGLIAIDLVPLDYNGDGAMDLAGINYSTGALMYLSNFISKSYHFSSTFIDFGQVDVGSSAMQSLTITNLGTEAVTIDSIRFMRHSYTARAMKNPVPARDTGSIEITFKPTAAGPDVDTMMVTVSADWTNFVLVSGTGHSLDGVTQLGGGIPKVYALEQNYPNPFNPWTRIRFAIPERSRVRLTVVNILGQELTELVNREVNAGYFEGVWNPRVSSGLYFYRIEAVSIGDPNKRFTNVKKMLLLK
jgi:hypothetical protein